MRTKKPSVSLVTFSPWRIRRGFNVPDWRANSHEPSARDRRTHIIPIVASARSPAFAFARSMRTSSAASASSSAGRKTCASEIIQCARRQRRHSRESRVGARRSIEVFRVHLSTSRASRARRRARRDSASDVSSPAAAADPRARQLRVNARLAPLARRRATRARVGRAVATFRIARHAPPRPPPRPMGARIVSDRALRCEERRVGRPECGVPVS